MTKEEKIRERLMAAIERGCWPAPTPESAARTADAIMREFALRPVSQGRVDSETGEVELNDRELVRSRVAAVGKALQGVPWKGVPGAILSVYGADGYGYGKRAFVEDLIAISTVEGSLSLPAGEVEPL
ncbi:MAG: hypothetical protein ACK4RV_10100 [Caulobacter sp.]